MTRIRINPQDIENGLLFIRHPQTLHYLGHVLRLRAGDAVECFDGAGGTYAARIIHTRREIWELSVRGSPCCVSETVSVILVQSLIRPERFEWVVEKATELGVSQILPVVTERTRMRLVPGRETARLKRWQRIAESAAAQSGRSTVARIEPPRPFKAVIPTLPALAFLPTLSAPGRLLSEELKRQPSFDAVALIIGPEGDFTLDELDLAKCYNVQPVSLGPLTLRAETAAVTGLVILRHGMGLL